MSMFCFQCEQTAGGKGCIKSGVCGKKSDVAEKHDKLTCALIGLARAAEGKTPSKEADELVMKGLFTTVTNVNFDAERIDELIKLVEEEKEKLGGAENFPVKDLWTQDADIVSLRSTLLFGIQGMAAYAWHAYVLGKEDEEVTAWQNQQKEFDNVPAPILFTTNCLMPPKASYSDRVFTTSVVGYPGMKHVTEGIDGIKNFSLVIQKALELGGYDEDKHFTGINGGSELMTGFARNAVFGVADKIIDAVKSGDIKHIFLVGGCDAARPSRNYYTEFVKKAPKDTVILTLACGKYRFNDLDIGKIGGLPRIIDMGQCNDAYSAIQVALALADAFGCGVNDLPLTLMLSWYEQKAVCILLTLLALGIRNIYLGPTPPAFFSSNVLNVLVDNFDLKLISTPEEDLEAIIK